MKDRCGKRGIGFAVGEHAHKVLGLARAAGSDHGNVRSAGNGAREVAIEAFLHAVGVHRSEQDLARAQLFAARRPFDSIDALVIAAAAGEHVPLARSAARAGLWRRALPPARPAPGWWRN